MICLFHFVVIMASGNLDNKGKGKAVLNDDISAPMAVDAVPLMAAGSSGGESVRSSDEAIPPAAMAAAPAIHPGSQSQQLDKSLILLIKCVM